MSDREREHRAFYDGTHQIVVSIVDGSSDMIVHKLQKNIPLNSEVRFYEDCPGFYDGDIIIKNHGSPGRMEVFYYNKGFIKLSSVSLKHANSLCANSKSTHTEILSLDKELQFIDKVGVVIDDFKSFMQKLERSQNEQYARQTARQAAP